MEHFRMKIAGAVGELHCCFGSTREYFREYLTREPAAFRAEITEGDRLREQALLDAEADREGLRHRRFAEPFLERSAIQRRFAEVLLEQGTLLLHGSTVVLDGRAYLFTAKCGVGKSTHTRLWRERYGPRAVMLNDDRAFLQPGSPVLAFGSPWTGKHGLGSPICAPLGGICVLERGTENRIVPLSPEEACPILLHSILIPGDDPQRLRASLENLIAPVPLWRMTCTPTPDAAALSSAVMAGKK